MRQLKIKLTFGRLSFIAALGLCLVTLGACGRGGAAVPSPRAEVAAPPAAAPLPGEDAALDAMTRFLEDRVRRDPEDFAAHNKLAACYLRRARETDNEDDLERAARTARASLAAMPAERNAGGLYALAGYEHATHGFAAARDAAASLIELDPGKSGPRLLLGDALLELGEYDKAAAAFRQAERINGGIDAETETRRARLAVLGGDHARARRHLSQAVALMLDAPAPSREAVAWGRWQLGETYFAEGDYEAAERHFRDALTTHPEYAAALASLARVRAARGDLAGAISLYERLVLRAPHPEFTAPLGDLYQLSGRGQEAAAQYALVERVARESAHDSLRLALFYADHDLNAEEAYARAAKEYGTRRDIYTADALAWTALKAGKIGEAQRAMREALRLGTRDAKLFYHAGMIARAAGDENAARDYMRRALDLNPQFDPLQVPLARRLLGG